MSKIFILPESVSSKIAAGEVIERPSSIIRELLDNSIDADANEITIKLEDAGIKKIIVSDNGCGIDKEDLILSLTKHATSKICQIDDLLTLTTMGFRGEALHSVQTISKITISTNTDVKGEKPGCRISNYGDSPFDILDIPAKKGTKIEVADIFYNIPARKKFLKSELTELNSIKKTVSEKAFSNPCISFKLYNNEKLLFFTKGDNDYKKLFFSIYNNENDFDILEHQEIINNDLKLKIFYSKSEVFFSTRKYQMLFVNKRPVSVNFFYSAVDAGLRNYVSPGRYQMIHCFIDINPGLIDVNIHPAKKEIKFHDTGIIFNSIQKTIIGAFNKLISTDIFEIQNKSVKIESNKTVEKIIPFNTEKSDFSYFYKIKDEEFAAPQTIKNNPDYQVIGVAFDTYIIVEKENRVIFIDQHAACEAIILKKKKDNYSNTINAEKLLIPALIEVSDWSPLVERKVEILNNSGFIIDRNEGETLTIRQMPEILLTKKDYGLACEIILEYLENQNKVDSDIVEYFLIEMSCKEAIKKGDKLNQIELAEITEEYFNLGIKNCPHGRPIEFELTKEGLDKIFQRRK